MKLIGGSLPATFVVKGKSWSVSTVMIVSAAARMKMVNTVPRMGVKESSSTTVSSLGGTFADTVEL